MRLTLPQALTGRCRLLLLLLRRCRCNAGDICTTRPLGVFDPLGLMTKNPEKYRRFQELEIKHGRIAMLATMGYITPEITGKFPGYLSPSAGLKFVDIPNGLAAISKVPYPLASHRGP